jgi:NADH dehydrogenase [ubiquinone] 1 alpha subcomplex assembly factor 7
MTPLEAEIRRIIAVQGPIFLAHYMQLCLGHPQHGYYMTRDPFGTQGDFTTAPEVSQMFGELIGAWGAAVWQQMGSPPALHLVELGPGRGTLMADALRATRSVTAFRAVLSVHLVETSPMLRALQERTLADAGVQVTWHAAIEDVPEGRTIAIANEFVDALPVDQFVKDRDGWHARMVGLRDNRLAFALSPDPFPGRTPADRPSLSAFTRVHSPSKTGVNALKDALWTGVNALRDAPAGALIEVRQDRPIAILAERIARHGGAALLIDYGHTRSGFGDTLQAVRDHKFADPLADPGEADLTTQVDFAALARTAIRAGARAHGPLSQGEFLRRLGIEARAARLQQAATPRQAGNIDAALTRLTAPDQMGELFKVLALTDPGLGLPPGFDT